MKKPNKKGYWKLLVDNIPLILAILITGAHWVVLAFQIPLLSSMPDWFWKFIPKPTGPFWLFALLVLGAIIAIGLNVKIKNRFRTRLVILLVLGVFLQYGFAFLEGRGLDAMRDRIIRTGHAEFAKVAVLQDDTYDLVSNYEQLLESRKLGRYANSKPPGTLLFYVFTKKIAQIGFESNESTGGQSALKRHRARELLKRLRNTATFLWPPISYLVLIPLYFW